MKALLARSRTMLFLYIAVVVAVLVVLPALYEIFRVPNYYVCDPFWPISCWPGF